MRPVTASHFSRSGGASSIRSGVVSSRAGSSVVSSIRPLTSNRSSQPGKQAVNLPTQDVMIKQRPVTAAGGLGSIQKSSNNRLMTRQNQDASYFFGLLRSKEKEIINEIEILKKKVHHFETESLEQGGVEAMYQSLLKDVRELEGTLADHNVANEKLRQGFDPEEIEMSHVELKMQNDKLSHDLDDIFVTKRQCEKDIRQVEKDIEATHESIKLRLKDTSDPDIYNDYKKHMMQIQDLQSQKKKIELQIEQMKSNFSQLEAAQSSSEGYERYKLHQVEEKKIEKLKVNIIQIDEDLRIAQLKPEEAHAYLLKKVKSTQAKVKGLMKDETEVTDEIKNLEAIQEHFQSLVEKSNSSTLNQPIGIENKTQYDEGRVDESIDTLKKTITEIVTDTRKKQDQILALLEDLSKSIQTRDASKPTEQGLRELSIDVNFRSKHLANSQHTMKRLLEEKEKRLRELELVENLEGKILSEEKELRSTIENMNGESIHYSNTNQLQDAADITKEYLIQMKERYIQRRDFMSFKVKDVSTEYRKNKQELDNSETWQSLQQLEEKIRRQGQLVFSLHKFVKAKEKQTNYEGNKNACLRIMNELLVQYSQ